MTTGQLLFFFGVLWWLVLFTTLPFGVRRDDDPEPGNDPGAPVKPRLWIKAAATTVISAAITGVVYALVEYDVINVREYLSTPPSGR